MPPMPLSGAIRTVTLPDDEKSAVRLLSELYERGDDEPIHAIRSECLSRFGDSADVRNFVYMVEVNRGINGHDFDRDLVEEAVPFWMRKDAERRWVKHSLLYCQGNAWTALKRYSEAISKYEEALQLQPGFAKCWKNMGSAYLSLDRREKAKECYERALEHNPTLFEALYCLGALLGKDGKDLPKALDCMNNIEVAPLPPIQQASVLAWRAILCLKLGRYSEGIENGEKAIQADSSQDWTWINTAKLYALARREDKKWLKSAATFWERFVKEFPQSGQGWSELGFTLRFLSERASTAEERATTAQRSLQAFEMAIRRGVEDVGLIWDLGQNRASLSGYGRSARSRTSPPRGNV